MYGEGGVTLLPALLLGDPASSSSFRGCSDGRPGERDDDDPMEIRGTGVEEDWQEEEPAGESAARLSPEGVAAE